MDKQVTGVFPCSLRLYYNRCLFVDKYITFLLGLKMKWKEYIYIYIYLRTNILHFELYRYMHLVDVVYIVYSVVRLYEQLNVQIYKLYVRLFN